MGKYQCQTMGEYARLLMEDAVNAVDKKVRTYDGEGREVWMDEPDLDVKSEVKAAFCEVAHHLLQSLASANAIEKLSGYNPTDIREYGAEHQRFIAEYEDDWSWVYEDDEEGEE